jgi:hypothetical protein
VGVNVGVEIGLSWIMEERLWQMIDDGGCGYGAVVLFLGF